MSAITFEELNKLPYLDTSALDGRTVNLMPLWDGASWHMWLNTPIGMIEGKIIDTSESDYLAKSAAKQSDLFTSVYSYQCGSRPVGARFAL